MDASILIAFRVEIDRFQEIRLIDDRQMTDGSTDVRIASVL